MKNFTNYINRIILSKIIIIICFLIFSPSVNASGFIFQWESIDIDNELVLSSTGNEFFIKSQSIFDSQISISDDYVNTFALSNGQDSPSKQKIEKKLASENIKFNFSLANSIEINKSLIFSNSDDEQLSKFIDALTSLIYDDSKLKSLETIGRVIEPHIDFYLEF